VRRPPFSLITETISADTVECLDELLERARAGEIIGIAYVAMFKRRKYVANATGEARRNPTFTRGMVRVLDDELGRRIRRTE